MPLNTFLRILTIVSTMSSVILRNMCIGREQEYKMLRMCYNITDESVDFHQNCIVYKTIHIKSMCLWSVALASVFRRAGAGVLQ